MFICPRLGLDLLSKMLIYNPSSRITAQEARKHPYFNDIPELLRRIGNV
jgi:serine/threonine protein kinase